MLSQNSNWMPFGDTHPHFQVRCDTELISTVNAHIFIHGCTYHAAGTAYKSVFVQEKSVQDCFVIERATPDLCRELETSALAAESIDEQGKTKHRTRFRMLLQECHFSLNDGRVIDIVGVINGDVLPSNPNDAIIDICKLPAVVRLPVPSHSILVGVDDFCGGIGRGVVHHQYFKTRIGLSQYRIEALAQVSLAVKHRNDDGR